LVWRADFLCKPSLLLLLLLLLFSQWGNSKQRGPNFMTLFPKSSQPTPAPHRRKCDGQLNLLVV
jgi:hypothetical protein